MENKHAHRLLGLIMLILACLALSYLVSKAGDAGARRHAAAHASGIHVYPLYHR